jgi:hypothetical protein
LKRASFGKSLASLTYPIVVRPGPELLLGALLGAVLSTFRSLRLPEILFGEKTRGVNFWFYAGFAVTGLLLALVLAGYTVAYLLVRHRTNDLRSSFDERYPPIESTT